MLLALGVAPFAPVEASTGRLCTVCPKDERLSAVRVRSGKRLTGGGRVDSAKAVRRGAAVFINPLLYPISSVKHRSIPSGTITSIDRLVLNHRRSGGVSRER